MSQLVKEGVREGADGTLNNQIEKAEESEAFSNVLAKFIHLEELSKLALLIHHFGEDVEAGRRIEGHLT